MSQEIKETMTGPISTSLSIQASFLTNVTVNIDGGYHSNSPTLKTAGVLTSQSPRCWWWHGWLIDWLVLDWLLLLLSLLFGVPHLGEINVSGFIKRDQSPCIPFKGMALMTSLPSTRPCLLMRPHLRVTTSSGYQTSQHSSLWRPFKF